MEVVKSENTKILKYLLIIFLGSILLTISSKIKIPFYPVPMTMQTFVVVLMGITFGWRLGVATISLYLFEGIIGLPVFATYFNRGKLIKSPDAILYNGTSSCSRKSTLL